MWVADRMANHTRELNQSNMGDAIVIGGAQALALIPGVSRSGITITAGLFRNMTREAAAITTQIGGEVIPSDKPGCLAMALREPAGVVLGIAPWNAPVILGVRALAMPLACGIRAFVSPRWGTRTRT